MTLSEESCLKHGRTHRPNVFLYPTLGPIGSKGGSFFLSNKVSKEEWVGAAALHHSLFDTISNSKIQPSNVTTATYENGSVWSLAWFYWTATGKITGNEIQIPVHHAFRFENEKIVEAYHFFDPTLIDAEALAAQN
mgnify:CR=1 FL=1